MQPRATAPAPLHRSAPFARPRSRLRFLLPLLLLVPACGGDTPTAGAPSASPATPSVDLARVGTLDPAPQGERVIPVTVTAEGAVHAFGRSDLSLADLRRELEAVTRGANWREPDGSSKFILLVNADAALPWVVALWMLLVAAEPSIGIYQVGFAARPRDAERVGVLGLALPKDRGIRATRQFVDELPVIRVRLTQGEGPAADPDAVGPLLETLWMKMGNNPDAMVHIELPAAVGTGVPTGRVLQTLDVAVRTGLSDVVFRIPALPTPTVVDRADRLQQYVRKLAGGESTTRIRVGRDHDVGAWPEDRPRPEVGGILPDDRLPAEDGFGLPLVVRILATAELIDEDAEGSKDPTPAEPSGAPELPPAKPAAIDAATRKAATEVLEPIRGLVADMEARYAAALEAKRKGDDAGWRTALGEALTLCHDVQDRWNEVIGLMPSNETFDEEETAAHHFPEDAELADRALTGLTNIERRLRR